MWPIFLEIIFWICQCCQSSEIRGICLMKQPSITVQIFPYFGIWKNPCGMYLDHFDHFTKYKSLISEEWWFRRSNKKEVATTINNNSFFYILTTLIGFGYNKDFLLTTNFSVWSTLSTNILHSNLVFYSFEYTILVNFCNFEYPPGLLCNWHCKKINLN